MKISHRLAKPGAHILPSRIVISGRALQGCRAAGLQGCRAAGLQGGGAAGLQECRNVGLQGHGVQLFCSKL